MQKAEEWIVEIQARFPNWEIELERCSWAREWIVTAQERARWLCVRALIPNRPEVAQGIRERFVCMLEAVADSFTPVRGGEPGRLFQ